MKTYTVHIAIGGDIGNTIIRNGDTPAEIIMMANLHTKSGVYEMLEDGEVEMSQGQLRELMNQRFTSDKVIEVFGPFGDLPTDITSGNFDEAQFAEPPKPVGRPKKKEKPAPVERNVADSEPEEEKK